MMSSWMENDGKVEDDWLISRRMSNGGIYSEIDEAAACEDVRRMAQTLGPQMSDLEDVLRGFSASEEEVSNAMEVAQSASRSMQEEDDDMDDELQQLAMSEQALRDELQFAHEINDKLSIIFTPPSKSETDCSRSPASSEPPTPVNLSRLMTKPTKESISSRDPPAGERFPFSYTLQDHAQYMHLETERAGGWYYCDMTQYLLPARSASEFSKDLVKDYCLPIPFRKLKRLYSGLLYHEIAHDQSPTSTPSKPPRTPATPIDTSTSSSSTSQPSNRISKNGSSPVTGSSASDEHTPARSPPMPQEEPLPVRTVAIRIRPDVLCGAVMDAIHHAFEVLPNNCTHHVLKRQGGHLRGAVYIPDKPLAYVADVQLCTQKNDDLDRRLVVRFYHIQDDPEGMNELSQVLQDNKVPPSPGLEELSIDEEKTFVNSHMKQACSLIQRLMAAQQQGGAEQMDQKQQSSWLGLRDTAFESMKAMQKAVGIHLESNFKPCPSVREENKKASPTIRRLTLPSLSSKDWPLLDVSWALTSSIMDELDTRDCTYNTLSTLPFGQFPSLPTLDVHYCSQLRRLSRDSMVNQMLKAAKDLEDYAKTAEYNCAICITLLRPMLTFYGIPPLDLPIATKPLIEYPLDYTPPQVAFPPWGNLVMEALNKVAARTPSGDIGVDEAVHMVFDAFIRQDDEEQAARLGRKNAQIMERLANLQSYQRELIRNIRDSNIYNQKAAQAAQNFLNLAEKAVNAGKEGYPRVLQNQVPLLTFRVSVGASTSGTCYIAAGQILFATTFIPIVGGTTCILFDLEHVDFYVDEGATSTLLNPFPNTMVVVSKSSKERLYSFRPTIGPARIRKFLKILQSYISEGSSPAEFLQVDNVKSEDDDGAMGLMDVASSEDQLSV